MLSVMQRLAWTATVSCLSIAVWTQVSRAEEAAAETATADESGDSDEYYELMKVLVDSFEQIDRNYVKDIDRRKLVEAAVKGMLGELDPYSDYISPEELAEFTEQVEQEFGGVGIQVQFDKEQRNILVMTPFPGSPAYKAGIRSGDRIVSIGDQQVTEFPEGREIETAVGLLKGEAGVAVTVGVRRLDQSDIESITMTRDIIQLDTVMGDQHLPDGTWDYMLDDERKIGYLRITHFTRRTSSELRAALKQLKDAGMQGLILDLRFNPGGLLQAAVEVSDLFIENGLIVSTEGRNVPPQKWSAKPFGTYKDFPMAVIVNHYSASASEIVSACLQDYDRAVIIGERTWGKGSVQNVSELEGGLAALKLTTASYHRPSGKNIHRFEDATEADEWGVVPNDGFVVAFSNEENFNYQVYRQQRDLPDAVGSEEPVKFDDKQLTRAIDYLIEKLAPAAQTEKPMEAAAEGAAPAEAQKSDDAAGLPLPLIPIRRAHHG